MEIIINAYNFLTSSPVLLPAVAGLAALSLWLLYRRFQYFVERATHFNTLAQELAALLKQDHGNPKIHYDLLKDIKGQTESIEDILQGHIPLCNDHFQNIDKLTDKTLFDRCPIDNCPAFQRVSCGYKDLQARLELFEVMAVEARKRTTESLDKMSAEMITLSGEMIKTLRETKRP